MKYNDLFDADGIFLETETYLLRRISPADLSDYEALAKAETPTFLQDSENASALALDELFSEEHLTCSILEKETQTFCGFCQLQWIASPTPELGVDLLPAYQKQGVAAAVLPAFLSHSKELLGNDFFYSKIKKNNLPSQKLAEKIGGILVGEKNLLPTNFPAEMRAFAEQEFPDFFYLEYHFLK